MGHRVRRRGPDWSAGGRRKADAWMLTRAPRELRDAFDQKELEEPLKVVTAAAEDMGVPV